MAVAGQAAMQTNGSIYDGRTEAPDQLIIETPEQVAIHFPVAGLGSRFLAVLLDSLIQGGAYLLLVVLLAFVAASGAGKEIDANHTEWVMAGIILVFFLLHWGYFTLFEAFSNGQTPGKRVCKLRVIRDSGRQITFFESMTRNLLRIVDELPGVYVVGVITMLCNRQNKRLGDLAAGTLVVHERAAESPLWTGFGSRTITAALFEPLPVRERVGPAQEYFPANVIMRLTPEDLSVIDRFFARAIDIDLARRHELAERLARHMTSKMGVETPPEVTPEHILESIAFSLRSFR